MTLIKVNNPIISDDVTRLINYYRNNPVVAAKHLLVRDGHPLELAPIQEIALTEWWHSKFSILTASRGTGKALVHGTNVLTPNGWIQIELLKVGDKVITPSLEESKITGVYPQGFIPTANIVLRDGRKCCCSYDHLWAVIGFNKHFDSYSIKSTTEIIGYLAKDKENKLQIPTAENFFEHGKESSFNLVDINSIEESLIQECTCIKIEDPEGLFLIDDYIVTHNTFLASVYLALKCILYPGTRSGIFAPAFRQSKLIFKEFTQFYEDSPIIQECVEKPPVQLNDQCVCIFKPVSKRSYGSFVKAFPLGSDGSKIRGERLACLTEKALLMTTFGLLRIGDLVKNYSDTDVKVSTPSNRFQTPIKFIENPPEETFRIKTRCGYSIEATADHKLMSNGILKPAGKLKRGNKLDLFIKDVYPEDIPYVPACYSPEAKALTRFGVGKALTKYPEYLDEDLAELLGFIVAEGSCNIKTRIEISQKDKTILNYFHSICFDKFGINCPLYKRVKKVKDKEYSWWRLYVDHRQIRDLFNHWGLSHSKCDLKEVPAAIFKSRKSVVIAFLRGFFEGDGGLDGGPTSPCNGIKLTSTSIKLLEQAQNLLANLGILSHIKERSKYRLTSVRCKAIYDLNLRKTSAIKFVNLIGFLSKEKKEKSKVLLRKTAYERSRVEPNSAGYFSDEIISIKKLAPEPTYDISLDTEDHLFWSNGFISHNCVLMDEIPHIPESIFRAVIQPMMSTSRNPMQRVKQLEELAKQFGGEIPANFLSTGNGYIGITSGYYQFNYWWQEILKFHTNMKSGSANYNLRFIPYTELPPGFFEEDVVNDARMNSPRHMFLTEWMAEWIADSEGAFPMSLLEGARDQNIIPKYARDPNHDKGKEFILGIDVARERDSTAIFVAELGYPSKLVMLIEMEGKAFPDQAKEIFKLIERFNPVRIYMDRFGGGQTLRDHLADPEAVGWPKSQKVISHDEEITHSGKRILKLCTFNPEFIEEANNNAKTLLEQGAIKFPVASHPIEGYRKGNMKGQNKEVDLVQEMINQVASVIVTSTASGRLHYDLPKSASTSLNPTVRKKDLYTAFILASQCIYELQWKPKADKHLLGQGVIIEIPRPVLTSDNPSVILPNRLAGGSDSTIYSKNKGRKTIVSSGGVILGRNGKKRR